MSENESTGYRKFWTQLLNMARERTHLHAHIKPNDDSWIGAMRGGIIYEYALRKDTAYVELWIDKGSVEANEAIFQGLLAHRAEIERAFGDRLIWHRARGRGRAVQFFASRYGFDDRNRWPEIQKALVDTMICLEAACRPHLNDGPTLVLTSAPGMVLETSNGRTSQPIDVRKEPLENARAIITMPNLELGIAEFKRRWPGESDFNNRLYRELNTKRDSGQLTWARLVDELSGWRALRTSIPGYDKGWYLTHGEKPFECILDLVARIKSAHAGRAPDITETHPEELHEIFEVARAIKGVESPVFASKLCHFVMPPAFPVADQDMLGISTVDGYWQYWQRCAEGWCASEEKESLKACLRSAMGTMPSIGYPWAVKIAELCHSGARQQRN